MFEQILETSRLGPYDPRSGPIILLKIDIVNPQALIVTYEC
ncbi:MAG: hypothetical protein WBE34_13395 [Candidatus Nitrosopolaris sp.]